MSRLKCVVLKGKEVFRRSRYGVQKEGVCERTIRALHIILYTPFTGNTERASVCVYSRSSPCFHHVLAEGLLTVCHNVVRCVNVSEALFYRRLVEIARRSLGARFRIFSCYNSNEHPLPRAYGSKMNEGHLLRGRYLCLEKDL